MAKQKTRKRSNKKLRDEVLKVLISVPSSVASGPPTETPSSTETVTIREVLERKNLQEALKRVISNKGCAGADGMKVEELPEFLMNNWKTIKEALLVGNYQVGKIKRAYIPKKDGSKRALGIPNVLDRLIQQGLAQTLTRHYDSGFSKFSYGFRPGRSCHQAIRQAKTYINNGLKFVVDIDLEKFFDQVDHDRLMHTLARKIKDKAVLKLIRSYLKAGILENGLTTTPEKGTPQGGPLSPILSNIVLHELDEELERRGHRFVRYADDCNIFVSSLRAGERVMNSVTHFLESKLKLKVNKLKSAVGLPSERTFLGFSFTGKDKARIKIAPSSIKRFKEKIRLLTFRGLTSMEDRIRKLSLYLEGWIGYFGLAELPSTIKELDQWIRRRLRMLYLKQWRKPSTRFSEFSKLGMSKKDCRFLISTTKGYWRLSSTRAMTFTLKPKYFEQMGLFFMFDYFQELKAS